MMTMRKSFAVLSAILYSGLASATSVEEPAAVDKPSFVYPQERMFGPHKGILYAPQIESWTDFERFNGVMAIEFFPEAGTKKLVGSLAISGKTEVDLAERLVYVTDAAIDRVSLTAPDTKAYEAALRAGVRKGRLEVPLDIFLLSLDDSILDRPPPAGFTKAPPDIIVSTTPAIVLFINGQPVLTDLPETGMKLVVNANWPLITDAKSSVYYLLDRELWLTATKPAGPWTATRKLPKGLKDLDKKGEHALIAAAVPAPKTKQAASTVHVREVPTELVVIDGEPKLEEIPGAAGLSYVTNSESALFKSGATWYYLAAGRWFSTADPFKGPWTFVEALPDAFAAIPEDHKVAYVRSAVRGTLEAKVAALESLLPKRKSVTADTKPAIEVSYAGDPEFKPIENTVVSRAVNTGYDVIQVGTAYYLCYAGVWYRAAAPIGPWTVATSVPNEIYSIPPSSPSYHVTQVTVVQSTPTTVVYEQTPAYSSSVYVVYGVPWYGTGYYYYPYVYGHYYYPYPVAYGHGSYYNPVTGGYGSRSVWYGPYGGYSYTQGYNPRTGRYGYVETAWDGDEWASHGETYNPRTGVASETSRYYSEDSNKGEMERTVQRGDEWVQTERETDFDQGTSTTTRETSKGGSSTTTRDGSTARTDFETGEGGKGTSISQGGNRVTVGQSSEGDLYAGHNGDVYKKTDDGWQSYDHDSGGWNQVKPPEAAQGGGQAATQAQTRASTQAPAQTATGAQAARGSGGQASQPYSSASMFGGGDYAAKRSSAAQSGSRDISQLNRDAAARQGGTSSFQRNRSSGISRSGNFSGGGGRTRRR